MQNFWDSNVWGFIMIMSAVLGSLLSLTVSKNLLRGAFAIFMIVAGSGTMVGTANTIARKYLRKRKIKQRKT